MRLVPRLIVLIAQPEVQRQPRRSLKVVLHISRDAPLPIADDSQRRSQLVLRNPVENKVRRRITGPAAYSIRIARKDTRVIKLAEEAIVRGVDIVLLEARRLHAEGEQVPSLLPGQVVVVVEGVVAQNLRIRIGTHKAGAKALSGKSGI